MRVSFVLMFFRECKDNTGFESSKFFREIFWKEKKDLFFILINIQCKQTNK
jgi:hypothetical protein